MAKQIKKDPDSEPLSEFQDVLKTGRTDDVQSKVLDIDLDKLQDARDRAARKAIEIRSATLKDSMFCKFRYVHNVGRNTNNKVTTDSEVPVHPDLVACFRRMDAHLATICEEVDADYFNGEIDQSTAWHPNADEKVAKLRVTSFSLDGTDDALSVVLTGTKELSTGEQIKLETPKIAIDESYPFAMELGSALQDAVREVEEYMRGKQAQDPQPELPFSEEAL